tara:strand:- start:10258 stop:10494 length:237 start_codon:yes stop_codon:yes gene_type:complete
MSRVSEPLTKMELEDIESRLDKIEQSLKSTTRDKSSDKNAHLQKNTYRVIKEDSNYYVEFKHKDGWIRSTSTNFNLRG